MKCNHLYTNKFLKPDKLFLLKYKSFCIELAHIAENNEYLALDYLIRTMYSKLECCAQTCALRAYSTGCLNIPGKLKDEFEIVFFKNKSCFT